MSIFKGYATALITPFTDDGKNINFEALQKLLDYQLESNANAIVLLGTTGEPSTMTMNEKKAMMEFCIKHINHKIPVIVGAGSNDTATACNYAKVYEDMGADALLIVTPYYNKCTQAGLIAHYTEISKNTTLPIILYNVPTRTGVNILPQTVVELSKVQNIVAIKEASGNVEQVMEIRRLCNDDFDIYSGEDSLTLPILSVGGSGIISVAGNVVPHKMHALCNAYFSGDIKRCRELQLELNPLIKLLFVEVNPIPIKTAVNQMGLQAGALRLPLTPMGEENKSKLIAEMKKHALIN